MLKTTIALAALAQAVSAAVPLWGQCGGVSYTGETTCESGAVCTYSDQWYSQCRPGTGTVTQGGTTTKTTTTAGTTTTGTSSVTGYVKTSGQKFTLNGSTFTVVGTNAYWLAQLGSTTDINAAFADIKKTGATAVRTWGFNEVTSASGTYYQSWSGSTPTINTGSNGLAKFDTVVSYAKANGLRLIVALTNNWADYGGMDVYVKQITGSGNHDYFYTNSAVKTAFKNYINAFVGRYKNEPGILAWELANEPRCKGSTGTSSGSCTTATITAWVREISAYIKSIDSNHLVGVGDEGFGLSGSTTYPYTEYEGLNFATNLAVSSIDFGFVTFAPDPGTAARCTDALFCSRWSSIVEMQSVAVNRVRYTYLSHCTLLMVIFSLSLTSLDYPEGWVSGENAQTWGTAWITNHATVQKSANKPVIIEEYGVTAASQTSVYTAWLNTVVSSGLAGSLIWHVNTYFCPSLTVLMVVANHHRQAGSHLPSGSSTHDDGYAIYPEDPVFPIITSHAAALKARG